MRKPRERRDTWGRFVKPCPVCMRRYRRQRLWLDVFSVIFIPAFFVGLLIIAVRQGWIG